MGRENRSEIAYDRNEWRFGIAGTNRKNPYKIDLLGDTRLYSTANVRQTRNRITHSNRHSAIYFNPKP